MREKFLLITLFLVGSVGAIAQNKTLGVGVVTPNPNASLHVESPTNNQGFIMPRLTTAQRTSISPLAAADAGLMVYDTDLKNVFIWDGTIWKNTTNGSIGSTGKFVVNNPTDTTTALNVKSSGLGNKGSAASFISTNTAGGTKPTVYINNATGTGLSAETAAGWAIIGRVTAGFGNAVSGYTTSTDPGSWGGNFTAQTGTAVYASTNSNVGGALAPVGVYGESTGTGSVGGAFWIQNPANNYPALYANTTGTGPAFRGETGSGWTVMQATHTGTNGGAGLFEITDTGNSNNTLEVSTTGTGRAGNFVIDNASNASAALNVETNGTGFGVRSYSTGTEVAGYFQTSNVSANSSTLFAMTNSQSGHGIGAINTAEGSAFSIFQGGMKLSTFEVTTGTTIATRAAAYRITGGGPFTLGFPSATGDMYMVFNDTGGSITFAGVTIPAGEGKTVINFNSGSFRGL